MVRVVPRPRLVPGRRSGLSIARLLVGCTVLVSVAFIYHVRLPEAPTTLRPPSKPVDVSGIVSRDLKHGPKQTIAYAVTVTGCGSDPITEGAAVLQHSIARASQRYDFRLFAIVHPSAMSCAAPLADLGYTILQREVFVKVGDIQGDFLRQKIVVNGCCGEKELLKLEAYTLTDYPIVVHLDLDVLILKPLDELFDAMLLGKPLAEGSLMKPHKADDPINAFFTLDYNMAKPKTQYKPVQGGFFVTRPDMEVYREFQQIVLKGDFREGRGWGGAVGPFYGSMTFQGLIPYYYNYLHPGTSVELNRCVYNQMSDNPRTGKTINEKPSGECRTGESDCEDCRVRPIEDVVTTHYTVCQKPWHCLPHESDSIQHRLCRQLHREWYRIRADLEKSWGRSGEGSASYRKDQFFGYCKTSGKKGYLPIEQPYGRPSGPE